MKKLFGSDSRLFMIMTLLLELAEINILFIVCSLPVLTMAVVTKKQPWYGIAIPQVAYFSLSRKHFGRFTCPEVELIGDYIYDETQ